MTTTQTQLRRDTAANLAAATPAAGEPFYDTTNKRLGVGDGSTAGGIPHASAVDVQKQSFIYPTVGGTADAITLTNTFPITAYAAPLKQVFKATGTNTGATTVNVDTLGAKNIYKILDGALTALVAGDIISGGIYEINYDGTRFQVRGLPNVTPSGGLPDAVTGTLTSGGTQDFTVDFTTYSAYDIYIENLSCSSSVSQVKVDVSTDAGSTLATASRLGMQWAPSSTSNVSNHDIPLTNGSKSAFVGTLVQGDAAGTAVLIYNSGFTSTIQFGQTRYTTSADIDTIRFTAVGGTFSTGNVILQPKSAR